MFRTLFVLLTLLAATGLLLASNVGTIGKQMAASSIFLLELNTKALDTATLYQGTSYSLSELGIAEAYIFGMYGYCRGSQDGAATEDAEHWTNIHFESSECTTSSTGYTFDPIAILVNEINNHNTVGVTVSTSDLHLPGGIDGYVHTASKLSQVVYICSIIAIALLVLTIIIVILLPFMSFAVFLEMLALAAAVISTAAATAGYRYVEQEFNKYGTDFGVHAQLSRNYLVLAWLGTGIIAVAAVVTTIASCMCLCSRPRVYNRVL